MDIQGDNNDICLNLNKLSNIFVVLNFYVHSSICLDFTSFSKDVGVTTN